MIHHPTLIEITNFNKHSNIIVPNRNNIKTRAKVNIPNIFPNPKRKYTMILRRTNMKANFFLFRDLIKHLN